MASKRKVVSSQRESSYADGFDSDGPTPALRRGSFKSGESTVTKRTLQNRKAQREFRKRREARVRDLEERCRRFDQMGLEANVELQRMARNLKEENEALRGFVIRIGYGNMMPSILDGVGNNNTNNETSFQPAFTGGFGEADMGKDGDESNASYLQQPSQDRRFRTSNKSATSAPAHQSTFQNDMSTDSWNQTRRRNDQGGKRNSADEKESPASETSSTSSHSAPLLSLSLHRPTSQSKQQSQPDFTTNGNDDASRARMLPASLSPNTAINNLLGQMNNQMNSHTDGGGMAGSAMLSNYSQQSHRGFNPAAQNGFAPYPIPQRIHQNDALLNPNPIPFAFNLSNEAPQSTSSWWEQMGGGQFTPGRETSELDEKAQAVAAAQANNGGAQSPFDLSAFLQGGITPGGGYSLAGFGGEEDNTLKDKDTASGSGTFNDTDHMRMFVRLLERKVAEREAHTVASLGFQPPSQDPSQRQKNSQDHQSNNKPKITFASALSPSGVYSRLAAHPAFLTTDARELEELVDALGSGAARSPSELRENSSNNRSDGGQSSKASNSPFSQHRHSNGSVSKRSSSSQSSGSTSGNRSKDSEGSVEVDERAIDRLMGLLDKKRMLRGREGDLSLSQQQHLSMAMT